MNYGELNKVEDLSIIDDDVLYKARVNVYLDYRTKFVERADCPVRFLDVYPGDDLSVMCGVADNPNTPVEVLEKLCEVALEGKFLGVGYLALKLVGNPNVPVSQVAELFWVSGACWGGALREAVPSNVLVEVLRGRRFSGVNENMPREWLWGLVESVAGSIIR